MIHHTHFMCLLYPPCYVVRELTKHTSLASNKGMEFGCTKTTISEQRPMTADRVQNNEDHLIYSMNTRNGACVKTWKHVRNPFVSSRVAERHKHPCSGSSSELAAATHQLTLRRGCDHITVLCSPARVVTTVLPRCPPEYQPLAARTC